MVDNAPLTTAPHENLKAFFPDTDAPAALKELYEALVAKAEGAMGWYESRQRDKKVGARRARGTAVFLGTLTTIIPSVIAFFPERVSFWGIQNFAMVRLNPVATVLGVLAGSMILLDKFYGFSSSWMRYVTTYQQIQSSLEEFRVNWRKQIIRLNGNQPPTDEQVLAIYDFLMTFLRSINTAVETETQAWVAEFKGVLGDMDKTVEAQKAAAQALPAVPTKGAINISVPDFDKLDDRKWTLQLDNRPEEVKEGQSVAAVPLLEPGIYKVRVAGRRAQKIVAAEYTVDVKPGAIFELKVDKLG
jgi:hypothetical protein